MLRRGVRFARLHAPRPRSRTRTRCPRRSPPSARRRPRASSRCSAAATRRPPRSTNPSLPARSSTSGRCSEWRRRCSASSSRTTRCWRCARSSRAQADLEIAELGGLGDGDLVTVGGIVASVARKFTKRGEPFAQFRLEDLAAGVNVVAFPNVYEKVPDLIETDAIILVKGRVDRRGRTEELQLRAVEVTEPDLGDAGPPAEPNGILVVELEAASCTNAVIAAAEGAARCASGPGARPGAFPLVQGRDATRRRDLPRRTRRRSALGAPDPARTAGRERGAARRGGRGAPRSLGSRADLGSAARPVP